MKSERLGIDVMALESDMGPGLIQKVCLPKAKSRPVAAKDLKPGDVADLEFNERGDPDLEGLYFYFYLIVASVAPRANGRVRVEFVGTGGGITVSQKHDIWVVVETGEFVAPSEM